MKKLKILVPLAIIVAFLVSLAIAQEEYEFMPKGGSTLLLEVLDSSPTCDDIVSIVTAKRTQEEWEAYFTNQESALKDLTEEQVKTLVAYLAINMPIPKEEIPEETEEIDWVTFLPSDGWLITLETCMNCHGLDAALIEERELIGWETLFGGHDHVILPLTEQQWETLEYYLAINMPIPEEDIPEEMWGAPPSY